MTLGLDEARAERAAAVCAVEHSEVLVLEVRGALDRLRSADDTVDYVDLLAGEPERTEAVERHVVLGGCGVNTSPDQHALRHRPRREGEGDLKDGRKRVLD